MSFSALLRAIQGETRPVQSSLEEGQDSKSELPVRVRGLNRLGRLSCLIVMIAMQVACDSSQESILQDPGLPPAGASCEVLVDRVMVAYYHKILGSPMDENFMEQRSDELTSCRELGAEEYRRVGSSVFWDHPEIFGAVEPTTVTSVTLAPPRDPDPYLSTNNPEVDALGVFVASSLENYLYFIAYAVDDAGELLTMQVDGRLILVSAGTPVAVVEEGARWSIVEILGGSEQGVIGWVHPDWVIFPEASSVPTSVSSPSTTTGPLSPSTTEMVSVSLPLEPGPPALRLDGLGVAYFGQHETDSVAALESAFGRPQEDSGWVDSISPWGSCPGESVRRLAWAGLEVFFIVNSAGLDPLPAGTAAFASYISRAGSLPLTTGEGIGPGSSQSELEAAYGPRLDIGAAEWLGGEYLYFLLHPPTGWPAWARMSGYIVDGQVESIVAGIECGE